MELLSGEAELDSVIQTDKNGIAVIPAGIKNTLISDLFVSDSFKKLLDDLRNHYDYVIIDSAPVLSLSDAEILSSLVDRVILVAEWAKTPQKKLRAAGEILRQFSKEVPSIILNKADLKRAQNG